MTHSTKSSMLVKVCVCRFIMVLLKTTCSGALTRQFHVQNSLRVRLIYFWRVRRKFDSLALDLFCSFHIKTVLRSARWSIIDLWSRYLHHSAFVPQWQVVVTLHLEAVSAGLLRNCILFLCISTLDLMFFTSPAFLWDFIHLCNYESPLFLVLSVWRAYRLWLSRSRLLEHLILCLRQHCADRLSQDECVNFCGYISGFCSFLWM